MLCESFPKVASMMCEANKDVLAFRVFPKAHWLQDLVERSDRTAKQGDRNAVLMSSRPSKNPAVVLWLATAVVIEAHHEWKVTRLYVSDVSMDEQRGIVAAKERAAVHGTTAEFLTPQLETA